MLKYLHQGTAVRRSRCTRMTSSTLPGMNGTPPAALRLRSTDLHWRSVQGEVLALDLRTDLYLTLNQSGALLWELLARGTSRAELVERLVGEYHIEPERAASDVEQLLDELSAQRLLEGT